MNRNQIAIDLGTYDIKVYEAMNKEIRKFKNAIAIRRIQKNKHVFAIADNAYEMYEKCPPQINIIFPMQNGVVSDFEAMQYLLRELIWGKNHSLVSGATYLLSAPSDISEVERRAFLNLIAQSEAHARDIRIVPRAIADAVGMGLNIFRKEGLYVVNIGGATTEYSVISSGGMVINRLDHFGGRQIDEAIAADIRRQYGFIIGFFASEELKNKIGSAYSDDDRTMLIPGRSLVSGLPGELEISSHEVYHAMRPILDRIIDGCVSILERIPPEMAMNVREEGMFLTGGVSAMPNLGRLLEREMGIPVHPADTPDLSTIIGMKRMLTHDRYGEVIYSMYQKKFRWFHR